MLDARAGNALRVSLVRVAIADAELGLGHHHAAMDALNRSQALLADSGDHSGGNLVLPGNASLYAQAGHADLAVAKLQELFAAPGGGWVYSPLMPRIDPHWDPIRNDPHFQALLKQYPEGPAKCASPPCSPN